MTSHLYWAFGDLNCDKTYATCARAGSVMVDRSVTGCSGLYIETDPDVNPDFNPDFK